MPSERGKLGCPCDGPALLPGAAAEGCDASVMMATKKNQRGPLLSLELLKPPGVPCPLPCSIITTQWHQAIIANGRQFLC